MGVNQARQDELAGRIDDDVVGGFRVHRSAGRTEMADPVSPDGDQGIRGALLPDPSIRVPFLIRSRDCRSFTLASCSVLILASL